MPDNITWTIQQISRQARTVAKIAAKKERKNLGVWLSRVIIESADKAPPKKNDIDKTDEVSNILSQLLERQVLLDRRLDNLLNSKTSWWSRMFS